MLNTQCATCSAKPTLHISRWPIAHQRQEHAHPHGHRGIGEVITIAVQRRLALRIRRFNAAEEKTPRHFLEVIGEVLAAHARKHRTKYSIRPLRLPSDPNTVIN